MVFPRIRFQISFGLFAAALLMAATVQASHAAESPAEAAVHKALQGKLSAPPDAISEVKALPYLNLYEVHMGGRIIYVDKDVRYLVAGNIMDLDSQTDLTQMATAEMNRIDIKTLPLKKAIKRQHGKADKDRYVVVFEDPNCTYCRQLESSLARVDNLTVYTFLLNVIAPDSAEISRNIWCSKDRAQAWEDLMMRDIKPPAAAASCTDPNSDILAIGHKLHIEATPTTFFPDGIRGSGALDTATVEGKLASIKKKQ